MRDSDSALGHHLDEVAVVQLVGDIPSDAENDDEAIKMAAMEEGGWEMTHAADYRLLFPFAPPPPPPSRRGNSTPPP
jgi:hypothetical protein